MRLNSLRLVFTLLPILSGSLTEVWSGREIDWENEYPPDIEKQETDIEGRLPNSDPPSSIEETPLNATMEPILKEYCYQDSMISAPFLHRGNVKGQFGDSMRIQKPIEFVVIRDGGNRCHARKECRREILSLRRNTTNRKCDLSENFYVGGDGTVYEGRGWDVSPFWSLHGMRNISITFMFLGTHHNETPSRDSQTGFEAAITGGLWTGKLSPDYKIASMRDIVNDSQYLGDSFHESLRSWDAWVNSTIVSSQWEYLSPRRSKFVFRRHWNASRSTRRSEPLEHPVNVVVLSDGGRRCKSRADCISQVKEEQESMMDRFGDLLENFYIGDDGGVYEGRGWEVGSHWRLGSLVKLVSVRFLGNFQAELPSEQAISAFKTLANTGIGMGKLDAEFSLISLRLAYNDSSLLGNALKRYTERWTPWKNKYNAMSASELLADNIAPITKHSRWSRGPKYDRFRSTNIPIKFVIVADGGEACFTYSQCSKLLNSEKANYTRKYGDIPHSFYVGSDGNAYEGRGWEFVPHLQLTILNGSYITVKFMGHHGNNTPHELALTAFNALINHGIHAGMISPQYQIYSYRHIYDEPSYLGDSLCRYLEGLEHWSSSWTHANDEDLAVAGFLPLVLRKDWSAYPPINAIGDFSKAIDFVVVGMVGKRCFSDEQCNLEMQAEENRTMPLYGDVPDNFYIGMNGIAYEGTGWRIDPYSFAEGVESKSITVSFIGKFEKDPPGELALAAFRRLVKYGINIGKLSETYKIASVRGILNGVEYGGEALHREFMTWDRWVGDLDETYASLRKSVARLMMVPRLGSDTTRRYVPKRTQETRPVEYIVVSNKGDRCFSREECGKAVASNMTVLKYAGYVDNFFIAEDGFVYEGLGWDLRSILNLSCSDCSFMTVVFLGRFNEESPSWNTTDTFNFLVKWGVGLGKISPEFRVLSIRQLCGNTTDIGDALHRHVSSGKHWSGNAGLTADCQPKQKLITHEEWEGYSIKGFQRSDLPIEHVFVVDRGERCYSEAHCRDVMRYEHLAKEENDFGIQENFYIGDDGNVYEGRGWGKRPQNEFSSPNQSINVLFFGNFEHETPSELAISALENIVIEQGLRLGKLSPDFTLQAVPDGEYPRNVGRKLKKFVRSKNRINYF